MTYAVLGAVLTGLAVRGWLPGWVACVALAPLFVALTREREGPRAAPMTAVSSLGLLLAAFEGALPVMPWALPLAVAVSLPWAGLPGVVSAYCVRRGLPGLALVLLPLAYTTTEYLAGRRWLWGPLASPVAWGYTQADSFLLPAATWSSVTGVSLLVLLANAGFAHCWRRLGLVPAALAASSLAAAAALSGTPQRATVEQSLSPATATVTIAQPAIGLDRYRAARLAPELEPILLGSLARLAGGTAATDLLLFPEGAVPEGPASRGSATLLQRLAPSGGEALAGAITGQGSERRNSVMWIHPGGAEAVFDKLALVPLGEAGLRSGTRLVVLGSAAGQVAPLICLDSLYPDFSRRLARQGAELIAVLSSDAFALRMATAELHLRSAAFRAAETGLPLAFASAGGPSGFFDGRGRLLARTEPGDAALLTQALALPPRRPTLFVRLGDWIGPACAWSLLAGVSLAHFGRSRALAGRGRPASP